MIQNHTRANKSAPLHTFKREQDMIQTSEPVLRHNRHWQIELFCEIADKKIRGDRHKPSANAFHDYGIESLRQIAKTVQNFPQINFGLLDLSCDGRRDR